ncbi:outer membrane beta-barrel protein [uncultured Eudoraea sp.]|uniref:outer membrane beta-barrel protein n=1 Tax=uncultured Eudoraea sp. TaxID=1035614 RepID=UPI0026112DDE|nr:outer membrane beta-barrel protein [uncultured Eudoraea sp.]
MKKSFLIALLVLGCLSTFAQKKSGFGIKAGLNYSSNGDYLEAVGEALQNPDANVGYHVGLFGKWGDKFYLRPEVVYTHTKSGYSDGDLKIDKLDVPVLGGWRIIGPLNIFVGPSFQYILNSKFSDISIDNIENDFTVGLNAGVGVNLGRIGLEIRYETGFGENIATFVNTNITSLPESRVDTRADQVIFSLSFKF